MLRAPRLTSLSNSSREVEKSADAREDERRGEGGGGRPEVIRVQQMVDGMPRKSTPNFA